MIVLILNLWGNKGFCPRCSYHLVKSASTFLANTTLIYFEKLYAVMNEVERRQLMETLISEIQIYQERQPNGQWLKSIKFKLPIIEEDMEMSLDNDSNVECIVLMLREAPA